ncbi:hypothetical protein [Nocardioides solisilvae]|nr:hypothetical protein [Nocardioides solisilvae]
MTTTPLEPQPDPEVVPSGDPAITPDPGAPMPGEDPGTIPDPPETEPAPV